MKKFTFITVIMLTVNLLSAQWIQQSQFDYPPSAITYFKSIFFIDGQHGWVIGHNEEQIPDSNNYLTTDGGDTWELSYTLLGNQINSVYFTDQNKGWTVGDGFEIQHTYNGSVGSLCSWVIQLQGGADGDRLKGQFFLDSLTGWAVGVDEPPPPGLDYDGIILHTSDGGINWVEQFNDIGGLILFDVYFFDPDHGISIGSHLGDGGLILLKTTDGGESWGESIIGNYGVDFRSMSFSFSDEQNGWIAGSYYESWQKNGSLKGIVLHTNNAGIDWIVQIGDTIQPFNDITFIDSNTGWIVGDSGTILHTANGGETWEYQESSTTLDLFSISFVDQYQGWICGDSAIILHTDNGGTVGMNEYSKSYNKMNIYPNPTNEIATITFKLEQKELVTLSVLNIRGQEVKQISLGEKAKGKINLDCSNFSPGIYFINLQTEKGILTEKLIIE